MHDSGAVEGNHTDLNQQHQDVRHQYTEDFMNLDENLFHLDSDSRDLLFGTWIPSLIWIRITC
jgi:hypothetical protein